MSDVKALNLIEYGMGGTEELPPPEGEPGAGRLRKPQRPVGMGTGGAAAAAGHPRLKYGMKPGEAPGNFVSHKSKDPDSDFLAAQGFDRPMSHDDVLDAYKAALGHGPSAMKPVNRMSKGLDTRRVPGLESAARQVVDMLIDDSNLSTQWRLKKNPTAGPRKCFICNKTHNNYPSKYCQDCEVKQAASKDAYASRTEAKKAVDMLIDGDEDAANALIAEGKKKAAKGKMVAKAPGKIKYAKEDCGVTYKNHGFKTPGKGKKAKTVAKAPGKVSYGKK